MILGDNINYRAWCDGIVPSQVYKLGSKDDIQQNKTFMICQLFRVTPWSAK